MLLIYQCDVDVEPIIACSSDTRTRIACHGPLHSDRIGRIDILFCSNSFPIVCPMNYTWWDARGNEASVSRLDFERTEQLRNILHAVRRKHFSHPISSVKARHPTQSHT